MKIYGIVNQENVLCSIEKRGFPLDKLVHPDLYKYYIEITEDLSDTLQIGAVYDTVTATWNNPEVVEPEPRELSNIELRKLAYQNMRFKEIINDGDEPEPLILYRNVIYTVDEALAQFTIYKDEDALNELIGTPTTYSKELGRLIPPAKNYIRKLYP